MMITNLTAGIATTGFDAALHEAGRGHAAAESAHRLILDAMFSGSRMPERLSAAQRRALITHINEVEAHAAALRALLLDNAL